MEFKVGDRVRLLEGTSIEHLTGMTGVVISVLNDLEMYEVDFGNEGFGYCYRENLELCEMSGQSFERLQTSMKQALEHAKTEGGLKFDDGKPPMSLLPFDALEEVAKVLAFGAAKYDKYNWAKGMNWSRILDATYRHLGKFNSPHHPDTDEETDLTHLAHAATNILFLIYYEKFGVGTDDRQKGINFENNRQP